MPLAAPPPTAATTTAAAAGGFAALTVAGERVAFESVGIAADSCIESNCTSAI
jgi:hypothetical protein